MDVLTRERAKPALPFAGVFQLVDIPLSNLTHSGVSDVWLSVQFQGSSLQEQVANGRPWDLDRTHGGLRLLLPQQGSGSMDEDGFATGNADELFRVRDQVTAFDPDVVVVMSADHVYRLDLGEVLATHRRAGAECTVVTTRVDPGEAGEHGVVEVEHDGTGARVTGFAYKPERPTTDVVATEVFCYDPTVLRHVLETLHAELGPGARSGDSGLGDFGDHLVPALVRRGRTVAHPLEGYWRDVGTPARYLRAHRDVLTDGRGVLGVPGWPILTRQPPHPPARILDGARVVDSLVSPGATVAGTVVRSVIGPDVVVETGAEVRDSVVFAGVVVERGAQVAVSVVDSGARVARGARVGSRGADPDDDAQIVLVGRGSTIGAGVVVEPGARLEPGTTA